jgi:hypothetical protein
MAENHLKLHFDFFDTCGKRIMMQRRLSIVWCRILLTIWLIPPVPLNVPSVGQVGNSFP